MQFSHRVDILSSEADFANMSVRNGFPGYGFPGYGFPGYGFQDMRRV
jgi:hypothetical protein